MSSRTNRTGCIISDGHRDAYHNMPDQGITSSEVFCSADYAIVSWLKEFRSDEYIGRPCQILCSSHLNCNPHPYAIGVEPSILSTEVPRRLPESGRSWVFRVGVRDCSTINAGSFGGLGPFQPPKAYQRCKETLHHTYIYVNVGHMAASTVMLGIINTKHGIYRQRNGGSSCREYSFSCKMDIETKVTPQWLQTVCRVPLMTNPSAHLVEND